MRLRLRLRGEGDAGEEELAGERAASHLGASHELFLPLSRTNEAGATAG